MNTYHNVNVFLKMQIYMSMFMHRFREKKHYDLVPYKKKLSHLHFEIYAVFLCSFFLIITIKKSAQRC